MLAKLARSLPVGEGLAYEPKWDGFRCLAFVSGAAEAEDGGDVEVDLRSRNDRPLARYFPEVVGALAARSASSSPPASSFVLDGELVVTSGGAHDFSALLSRLH